jgi:hypothetical protein
MAQGVIERRMRPTGTLGGLWREEALDRIYRIVDEQPQPSPEVAAHLDAASELASHRQSLAEWWTGSRIESCWRELRSAEEMLVRHAGGAAEALAHVVSAQRHAKAYLSSDDVMVKALTAELEAKSQDLDTINALAREVLVASHAASDRQHRELRAFKNGLRLLIGLLALGAVALVCAVELWKWSLLPAVEGFGATALTVLALTFGAVGALFSALPSLAQVPESSTSFSPVREQAALKVVVGAWSAVIGLMAASAGLAMGVADGGQTANPGTLAGFAMMAALFGASQEAITRFADHKATGLRDGGSTTTT